VKKILLFISLACIALHTNALTQDERLAALRALNWHEGPQTESVVAKAHLKTPEGVMYIDEENSKKFLELTGNVPEKGHNIIYSRDGWWATFAFNPIGFVKDDEKIDAESIMKTMKEAEGPSNEERKRLGLPALYTDGWYIPPHYDTESKRLEWGIKLHDSDGRNNINYSIRLLGRTGVMSTILVSSADRLDSDIKAMRTVLKGFDFNDGERYSEFKQGDRIAEFGLAALIAGGAAAVATKKGFWAAAAAFFAAFWKVIAGVGVALAAWFRSKFKGKTS
jgi:uncharacterized membrane-anchored protein